MGNNSKYLNAKKRVKQIKGFYLHALIYVLANILILLLKFQKHGNIEVDDLGIGLWGVALLIHGAVVFIPDFFLGKNWEERKIREIMDKNNNMKP